MRIGVFVLGAAAIFAIGGSAVSPTSASAELASQLSGMIRDGSGAGLAGADVYVHEGALDEHVLTDSEGHFSLFAPPGGALVEIVAHPNGIDAYATGSIDLSHDRDINVTLPTTAIDVLVQDAGGTPVAGVNVQPFGENSVSYDVSPELTGDTVSAQLPAATTGGDGHATVRVFPTDKENVLITPSSGSPYVGTTITVPNATANTSATATVFSVPTSCPGADIVGIGSTLQREGQQGIWIPGFAGICGAAPKVTYKADSSGAGLAAWDFNGPDGTAFDTTRAFTASDEAPSVPQLANAEAAAGGAKVLVIPVAQTAIGIIVHPPENCSLEEISNKQLENAFRGEVNGWTKFDAAEGPGCAGEPVVRLVPSGLGSGSTYQFKNYLFAINPGKLPCTRFPSKTWKELAQIGTGSTPGPANPNLAWPESGGGSGCKPGQLSGIQRPGFEPDDYEVVKEVGSTEGTIGFAPLPDIEYLAAAFPGMNLLRVQNNGLVKFANASFATPVEEANDSANCRSATYVVPVGGRTGESGESADWSQVFGSDPNIARDTGNSEAYPLCTLTYDMALGDYAKAGFSTEQEKSVRAYLAEYVTAAAGQEAIESGEGFYDRLPSSSSPSRDVLRAAQLAAGRIH